MGPVKGFSNERRISDEHCLGNVNHHADSVTAGSKKGRSEGLMKKSNLLLEGCLLAFAAAPVGLIGSFYWITRRRIPDGILATLFAILSVCIATGIVKRLDLARKLPKKAES